MESLSVDNFDCELITNSLDLSMKYIVAIALILLVNRTLAQQPKQNLPLSTQLTLSSATIYNKNNEVLNVFMIINTSSQSKGTGFLIKSGHIITCEHVIHGAKLSELKLQSPDGMPYAIKSLVSDSVRDLAIITVYNKTSGGFSLGDDNKTLISNQVYTWGFPLGYSGPSPLLSVGFVSGVIAQHPFPKSYVKHFVINGAFNPGNSGGPLIDSGKIIGIVQSKAAPMTEYILSALNALRNNSSGMMYTSKDATGTTKSISEAQVIEQVLEYYRDLAQVMIGEAVTVNELKHFLAEQHMQGY